MAEAEEEGVTSEEQQQQHQFSSSSGGPEDTLPAARTEDAEGGAAPTQHPAVSVESSLGQFKLMRFFVLRVNAFTSLLVNRKLCAAAFHVTL